MIRRWMEGMGEALLWMMAYVGLSVGAVWLAPRIPALNSLPGMLFLSFLAIIALILWVHRRQLTHTGWFTKVDRKSLKHTLRLSLASVLLVTFLLQYVFPQWTMPEDFQETFTEIARFSPWVTFAVIGFLGPLTEELLFRGAILQILRKKIGPKTAVLISSILFALIHWNLYQASYTVVLGLLLGIIALKSGSLWLPMIFHILYNTLSAVLGSVPGTTLDLLFIKTYIAPFIGILLLADSLKYFIGGKRR